MISFLDGKAPGPWGRHAARHISRDSVGGIQRVVAGLLSAIQGTVCMLNPR